MIPDGDRSIVQRPPLDLVIGIGRAVRRQRQRFDVVAHVRRVTARALRVQERYARAPLRVPVES